MSPVKRCAIYTRKSSEEGLEQGFNSLHAQRESCEAYVLSQAGEGWSALPTQYDDGGYSGGNMDRPGLKALMADIARGRVDTVVCYKVDRLTRSLADFAKIVDQFDARGVSFVSVTQAFNTTTSMGRLTLNVLLSFAQFEREVTGERIRDKIAQSKAKGMCMGGRPPLGYDIKDSRYVVNEAEAPTVRWIFQRYLDGASVLVIADKLEAAGVRSKAWINKHGKAQGGAVFSRGALQHLLTNPVYTGAIRHKDKLYPNSHAAVVEPELWSAVQTAFVQRKYASSVAPKRIDRAAFKGRVFDDRGTPMQVVEARAKSGSYLYYQSPPRLNGEAHRGGSLKRASAQVLDAAVRTQVATALSKGWMPDATASARVGAAVERVVLSADRIAAEIKVQALAAHDDGEDQGVVTRYFAIRLARRQGALLIQGPGPIPSAKLDTSLMRAVALARRWAIQIETGEAPSIKALASANGLCEHYTAKLLALAYLAPDLVATIVEGRQPQSLTLAGLIRDPLPLSWDQQHAMFYG